MSERAFAAYENDEKPLSKWTKKTILEYITQWLDDNERVLLEDISDYTKQQLVDEFLDYTGWHHTSKFYNETEFYKVDEDKLLSVSRKLTDDELEEIHRLHTVQSIQYYEKLYEQLLSKKKDLEEKLESPSFEETYRCEVGSVFHRMLQGYNWTYHTSKSGTVGILMIDTNSFYELHHIGDHQYRYGNDSLPILNENLYLLDEFDRYLLDNQNWKYRTFKDMIQKELEKVDTEIPLTQKRLSDLGGIHDTI